MADTAYEQVICVKNEVLVYRIPPRPSNRGHRASEWKLDAPDWTGRLRVISVNNDLFIKLEDKSSGELFAQCPVEAHPGIAVEAVMDSSRYFVLRIKDDSGRSAFIGIGFHDRADSFDLNVSLQDHFKHLRMEAEEQKNAKAFDPGEKLDLGFKEGQTIRINFGNKTGDTKPRNKASSGGGGAIAPLPPPPGGIKLPPPSSSSRPKTDNIPAPLANPSSSSTQQNVDLLLGLDSFQPNSSQGNSLAPQNAPAPAPAPTTDFWGDFTGASGSQQASSGSQDGNWIQF